MARLIDSEKLIEYCNNQKVKTIDANDIARFPAVDAAPVVHSGWEIVIQRAEGEYDIAGICTWATVVMCSRCAFVHHFIEGHMCYGYCPNCGAKMDLEETKDNGTDNP